jgi:hypothetical protein
MFGCLSVRTGPRCLAENQGSVDYSESALLKVGTGNRSKNIPVTANYEGTQAFLKNRKPGLFVNFS